MKRVYIIASVIFVLDQITKYIVVQSMGLKFLGEIEVFPPYITFRMAWNRGINFGLFANPTEVMRWFLIIMSLVIAAWLWHWARRGEGKWGQISIGFIIGGALGNTIDRVVYGAVADFLNVTCCGFYNPYAFNISDISIFIGAFGLILFSKKTKNNG